MFGMYIHDDIIAERRVRECRETGAVKIDFTPLSLNRIPPEMAGLTQLTEINFDADKDEDGFPYHGNGKLLEVPEYFGTFSKLETLNISCTSMVRFPASLENLSSLKNLALPCITHSGSPTLKVENLDRFFRAWHNLETLHISLENLPALAGCIEELPRLKSLVIGGIWQLYGEPDTDKPIWEKEPEDKPFLKRSLFTLFEKLALKKNFTELAIDAPNDEVLKRIAELAGLETLLLVNIESGAMPGFFEKLTGLKTLHIESEGWENKFKLPESLSCLTRLESLSLTIPGLRTLPGCIGSFTRLKNLELENCGLHALPESIGSLTNLEQLRIVRHSFRFNKKDQNITGLPKSFGNLRRLKKLELVSTEIEKLPESIKNLTAMEELTLNDDTLAELPASLSSLKSLRTLRLSVNHVSVPDFIGEYPELEELTFNCCMNLRTVPGSIGNLRSLKRLGFIHTNALERIPESLGNLAKLEAFAVILDYRKNGLLPDSLTNCRSLKRLRLYGLNALPEQIGNLVNLEKLIINDSDIRSIPASIGNITALKELRVNVYPEDPEEDDTAGKTIVIPESAGNLCGLETLELHSALFDRLPESVGALKKLETLDLAGNFKSLPESVGNCVSLKVLRINGSKKRRLDECTLPAALVNLSDLRSLRIIDYPVKNLPDLSNWKKLRVLELIRTGITVLPENTGDLTSLQYLALNGSPVEELPETAGSLANLECLDICNTNIRKFPRSMDNLSNWSQLTMNEVNMTALLESAAELRHLPYIEVINPKIRQIPQPLKDRDDFYYNGNREHPRICAELWEGNSITSGVHFLPEPLPVRMLYSVTGFFIGLIRNIRFAAINLTRRNKK